MVHIGWLLYAFALLFLLAGALFWIFALQRRLAEKAAEQRLLHELLDKAEGLTHFGSWQYHPGAGRLHWSPRVFAIHQRPVAWGEPGLDEAIAYYHPDDRALVRAALERTLSAGMPFEFAARIMVGKGEARHVISRGTCHRDARGRIGTVFGIFIETAHVVQLAEFVNDNPASARSRQP